MKRLLFLLSSFILILVLPLSVLAEGLYSKRLRLDAKQLRRVLEAEEKMLSEPISPIQVQKLEKPIVATASVPYVGTIKVIFTKLRRFPNAELRVVGSSGKVSYPDSSSPVFLQGYFRKNGKKLGPAAAQYFNERLKVTLLLDSKGRPIDLIADTTSGESGYLDLKSFRYPSHRTENIACSHAEHSGAVSVPDMFEAAQVKPTSTLQLDLELDGDRQLYLANGSNEGAASASMLSVANAVDAIYQRDLGVSINVISQTVYTSTDQPYTTKIVRDLLNEISANSTSGSHDLTHLITGRDVCDYPRDENGDPTSGTCSETGVAGLAWVGVVCVNTINTTGLSERFSSDTISAIITAHEIGHNFNGSHSSTINQTIMDASIVGGNGDDATESRFSSSSISEITSFINANNSCLTAAASGDIAVSAGVKTKKGKVTLTANYGEDRTGCTVSFALSNKSDFSGKLFDLGSFPVSGTSSVVTGRKNRGLKKGSIYARGMLTCGSEQFTSASVRLPKKKVFSINPDRSKIKAGKWIRLKKIKQVS